MSTSIGATAASLRILLEQVIDYAGLFPPASQDMHTSVDCYSRYLHHPQSWALGRFVLPLARLEEFVSAQVGTAPEPWHLSGIVSANAVSDLAAADAFNRRACGAVIDAVEVRVSTPQEIELVAKHQPQGTAAFFEIAPESADELLPIVRRVGGIRQAAHRRSFGGCVPFRRGNGRVPGAVRGVGLALQGHRRIASSPARHPSADLRCKFARGCHARLSQPPHRRRHRVGNPRRVCSSPRLPLASLTRSAQTGTSAKMPLPGAGMRSRCESNWIRCARCARSLR